MTYQELLILLPCHSLEDFPTYHDGESAEGLLANWTALWHPALIASAGMKPNWCRVDAPPADLDGRLMVVPSVSMQTLPTGFAQRAKSENAVLIRKLHRREEILAAALEPLGTAGQGIDPEIVGDFLALGYAYLQIQLLTRQMRYASNLDEVHFENTLVSGAKSAAAGDVAAAREQLTSCYSLLAQEKDHYYPVDAYLIDITMVAPTTVGASLRRELAERDCLNLLVSGETLTAMAEKEPETLAVLRDAVSHGRACIIGGEVVERRLPLLARETLLGELQRGLVEYERLLGKRPVIFGRRRFGLTPALPAILTKLGFEGALHFTLDDGVFPSGSQFKIRWQGSDGTLIDAIARPPLDASKAQTFLSWGLKLGESMDSDHVATLCAAHWPTQESPWLNDLRRISKYMTALGKFMSLDRYFHDTEMASVNDKYEASQYRSPYLKQAIIRRHEDPISTSVRYWQRRAALEAQESIGTLAACINRTASNPLAATATTGVPLADAIDNLAEDASPTEVDVQLSSAIDAATKQFSTQLPRAATAPQGGYLIVNPLSFSRRMGVQLPRLGQGPTVGGAIYAHDSSPGGVSAVVDLPALGYAWITAGSAAAKPKRPSPSVVEGNMLRNEFFEIIINPITGSLQSIHEYEKRGNRLSQQLAIRQPPPTAATGDVYRNPDETAAYSVMAADSLEITQSNSVFGEITTRGRLLNLDGKQLAGFVQRYRLWRGSRVLQLEIELAPDQEPQADPWNSYYACRFAWADETAELYRTVSQSRQPVGSKQFEAPHYVQIESGEKSMTILTGGLPFHRKVGTRMLDTLLLVRGERTRKFRLGMGLDLTHPWQDANSMLAPAPQVFENAASPTPASSWLFHLDTKNVAATHWEPVVEDERVIGFRVRLLETTGRPARTKLSCFKPATTARQIDFQGKSLGACQIDQGAIRLDLGAHEWAAFEVRW